METTNVIISPVITEKATDNQALGQYSFYVRTTATKIDIINAIRALYGVEVEKVRVISLPKKTRLLGKGRVLTKRQDTKKAIVSTKGKKPLDFNKTLKK